MQYKILKRVEEVEEVVALQEEIWGLGTVTPLPQLLASIHNGGVLVGAFQERQLIGFCFGFPGYKDGTSYLVSHMAGVRRTHQNAGIGFGLKLKQREWAIGYGYRTIVWTFDPLEARNGYFNLCKLGGYSRTYVPAYYGELKDNLNTGLPTDRLVIEWDLESDRVERALAGSVPVDDLETDYELWSDGEKERQSRPKGYLVPVPANIQDIKMNSPDMAMNWRMVVRRALSSALLSGYVLSGVRRSTDSELHYYVLVRDVEVIRD